MRAIILAAGRGSRMRNATEDKPKCLVELAGKRLLEWQLAALRGAGIKEIGIVKGYLAEKLDIAGLTPFENSRWDKTNMVMSLVSASEWLRIDECVVSYSDIVYPAEIVTALKGGCGDIVITYDRNWLKLWKARFMDPLADAETFRVDSDGHLLEIGDRARSLDEIKGQYMGLLKISPKGWKTIEEFLGAQKQETGDRLDITGLLKALLMEGVRIDTVPVEMPWYEVDNEKDLDLYELMARRSGKLW